jgi:hypothetical protein
MRKILRAMVSDGMLALKAKKYRVCQPSLRTGEQVWFITPSINFPPRSALNPAEYRVLNVLERECSRRRLRLHIVEHDFSGDAPFPAVLGGSTSATLGYVVDVWWFDQSRIRDSYTGLIELLAKCRKPVALIDEAGNFALPPRFCANPLIQAFKTSDWGAGMMIAQLLRQQGHESAAFISIYTNELWSQQRCAGAAKIFPHGGLIQHGSSSSIPWFWFLFLFLFSGFKDSLIRKIMAVERNSAQAAEEFKLFSAFRGSADTSLFTRTDKARLRHDCAILHDLMLRNPGPDVFPIAFKAIDDGLNSHMNRVFHRPLFKKALAQRAATAWICANDISALGALDFLRENEISVPREISVTGFDNLPDQGLKKHLTSFDFNAQGIMFRVMEYLARPPRQQPNWHHTPIEVEGIIMERESTGPARK